MSRVLAMGEICYWAGFRHDRPPATKSHNQLGWGGLWPCLVMPFTTNILKQLKNNHLRLQSLNSLDKPVLLAASPIRSTICRRPRSPVIEGIRLAIAPNPPSSETQLGPTLRMPFAPDTPYDFERSSAGMIHLHPPSAGCLPHAIDARPDPPIATDREKPIVQSHHTCPVATHVGPSPLCILCNRHTPTQSTIIHKHDAAPPTLPLGCLPIQSIFDRCHR